MPNMNPNKCPMPEQAPDVRNKNFEEVTLGYTAEMAIEEAQRCLNCKNKPCMTGCPVQVKIPEFISLVAEGKFLEAAAKIKETSALPAVCGRVCPQESQCECHCVRGIKGEPVAIGRLERFVADYARENSTEKAVKPESNGHKVAIVGAGPAGLTCAGDLARMGYEVTVFEALHTAGGVLMYGIPEFRLPKAIVQKEIDTLKDLGVEFVLNFVVGRSETIDELFGDGYEAIFVGSGAGLPTFIGVPGENANGVYSANEYLTRINLMKAYKENSDTPIYHAKKVAVVGGGLGCAIAYPQAKKLHEMGVEVDLIAGFRSKDIIILEDEMKNACTNLHIVTDDGSNGRKALVTQVLKELIDAGNQYDAVIAIGPMIMMKFVCETTRPYGIKTIVSMNTIMVDGTGMCGGCRLTVGGETKFACVDGPDFDGHLVDFDSAMRRGAMYKAQEKAAVARREEHCNLFKMEVK